MPGKVYRGSFQELNALCAIKDRRIAALEEEIALIRGGTVVVVPVSTAHAEAMHLVADRYLKDHHA